MTYKVKFNINHSVKHDRYRNQVIKTKSSEPVWRPEATSLTREELREIVIGILG